MGQMEADGRIGGEPVSQTMDNQAEGALTPEELAMLREMGMAVGGMVPPPEAVGNTGEYNKGGQVLYAQDGVDVTAANASTSGVNPYQAQFTQGMGSAFAPGYLSQQIIDDYKASQAPQTTIVMLYSPDGIAVSVTLPAEQAKYDQLIAEGYTTEPVATTTETTVTTGNDDPPPPETAKAIDYTGMSTEELAKAYSQNQTAMAMMAGMAAINPIFGAFGAWATNNTKKKILAAGYEPPEGGSIFDISLGDIGNKIKELFGLSDEEAAKAVSTVNGGDDKTVTPLVQEPSPSAITNTGMTFSDKTPSEERDDRTAAETAAATGTAEVIAAAEARGSTAAEIETIQAAGTAAETQMGDIASGRNTTGQVGFKAGGFVSKRSKKNKKK
jgi:hypothetical protein